jgi:hypothetical protein
MECHKTKFGHKKTPASAEAYDFALLQRLLLMCEFFSGANTTRTKNLSLKCHYKQSILGTPA